jgi:hypothetical protein
LLITTDLKKPICENSFVSSTSERPSEGFGSNPNSRSIPPDLYLEVCSANDPRYAEIRERHYVQKAGTHGQQVHFLVWYQGRCVGIISGASSVFGTAARDTFFGITKANRHKCLSGIIDNVVFRLELNQQENHLASKIVLLWEECAAWMWEKIYGAKVFGFETFIVKEGFVREEMLDATDKFNRPMRRSVIVEDPSGKHVRNGGTYRAAGWSLAGQTSGSTKGHNGVGLTGGKTGKGVFLRKVVPIKDVYCKWVNGISAPIERDYKSSWKASTPVGTPEEKKLARLRTTIRRELLGTLFYRAKYLNRSVLVQVNRKHSTWELIERRNAPKANTRAKQLRAQKRPTVMS